MICIKNSAAGIYCSENGRGLALVDRNRGTRWVMDEKTLVYGPDRKPLVPFAANAEGQDKLVIAYRAGEISVQVIYEIKDKYVEVRLPVPEKDETGEISLAGSFIPAGEDMKLLLPIMQGMLWDGRGEAFNWTLREACHLGFSMAFIGYMGESGGLLFTAETRDDLLWWVGKDESGRFWASNLQINSLGAIRYERAGRLYFTDADIVRIAKTYRKKVIEQGNFKSWEEKIAERPGLERLFGALMCYVGYCKDDIDYVAECKKLKAYGFDRALVYPGRFNIYYPDIEMGGVPAINMKKEDVEAIKAIGYDVAPWTWINEALDDGTDKIHAMYRKDPDGKIIPHWAIDEQQWYLVCSTFFEEYQREAVKTIISDMTWDHFDVLACATIGECYALDHPNHMGHPLSRSEDRKWIKKGLMASQKAGRAVSSESFNDAYSLELDFGSVKAWPQYGSSPLWPIPLTMLVYHDSMIHSWWELHSYNNHWRGRESNFIAYGGGRPRQMAAMDALMGCPPDVFPFGAQYGYNGRGRETFLYKYRFEDPEVQIALREALPVAKLHRRIGKLEMVHFKMLSEDGYVQETAFSDGTRVIANFSPNVCGEERGIDHKIVKGIDSMMPESWKIAE